MRRTLFISVAVLLLLCGCTNSQKKDNIRSAIISETSDGRVDLYEDLNEIVLFSNNTFLFYKHVSIDSLLVVWGNAKCDKVQYDTLPMFSVGPPTLYWHNDNFIALRQGCGTDCFFAYIMDIRSETLRKIMYPMAYDTTTSRIAYSDSGNPDAFLVVEDLLSGDKQEIVESYEPGTFSAHSIDSIRFTPDGLYVKWLDAHSQPIERIF